MEQARIIVVGCGKMAQELLGLCEEEDRFSQDSLGIDFTDRIHGIGSHPCQVVVHFGSGRALNGCLNFCQDINAPLIQGSTGQTLPQEVPVPVVNAPNLSLPIIRLLNGALPALQKSLGGMIVTITESHQASKKSVPGTAVTMAETFGLPKEAIVSVREPAIQRQLGVAEEHLDGHGYHWINFQGGGVNITVSTQINGRRTYAHGALAIADALIQNRDALERRVYQVADILEMM